MKLNNIDLNKLQTFVAIVDEGSATRAAEALNLTRSAISQSLSTLEFSLGIRLFNRVGKRLVLTPEGRRLHATVKRAGQFLIQSLHELTDQGPSLSGTVRLGVFLGFAHGGIMGSISQFLREHENVQVKFFHRSPSELERLVLNHGVDLAISVFAPPLEKPVEGTSLTEDEMVLVGVPSLLGGKKNGDKKWEAKEILTLPVVDYYRSSPLLDRWLRHGFGVGLKNSFAARAYGGTTDTVKRLIVDGVGVGIMPRYRVAAELQSGSLVALQGNTGPFLDRLWLLRLKGGYMGRTSHRLWQSLLVGEWEKPALR